MSNKVKIPKLRKTHYCIPYWCKMHPYEHFDGMGGCWGISSGLQLKGGEDYCKGCEYYKKEANNEQQTENQEEGEET